MTWSFLAGRRDAACSSHSPHLASTESVAPQPRQPQRQAPTRPKDMTVQAPQRKLRILALHGYLQSADTFKQRVGSLRKALKSRCEFVFLDAPFHAVPFNTEELQENGGGDAGRSWWQWTDIEPGTRPSRAAHYSGWEVSQAAITEALQAHAPVDGLLGFSQGATAVALYLSHCVGSLPPSLRFAVLVSGFLPRDASYAAAITASRPSLPSLMVSGGADTLVPEERTRQLAEAFGEGAVQWLTHPGGHCVPTCSGDIKEALRAFLDAHQQHD